MATETKETMVTADPAKPAVTEDLQVKLTRLESEVKGMHTTVTDFQEGRRVPKWLKDKGWNQAEDIPEHKEPAAEPEVGEADLVDPESGVMRMDKMSRFIDNRVQAGIKQDRKDRGLEAEVSTSRAAAESLPDGLKPLGDDDPLGHVPATLIQALAAAKAGNDPATPELIAEAKQEILDWHQRGYKAAFEAANKGPTPPDTVNPGSIDGRVSTDMAPPKTALDAARAEEDRILADMARRKGA